MVLDTEVRGSETSGSRGLELLHGAVTVFEVPCGRSDWEEAVVVLAHTWTPIMIGAESANVLVFGKL